MEKHISSAKKQMDSSIMDTVENSADMVKDYLETSQKQGKKFIKQTEKNVKQYPLRSVGIAALVGFLVGYLVK